MLCGAWLCRSILALPRRALVLWPPALGPGLAFAWGCSRGLCRLLAPRRIPLLGAVRQSGPKLGHSKQLVLNGRVSCRVGQVETVQGELMIFANGIHWGLPVGRLLARPFARQRGLTKIGSGKVTPAQKKAGPASPARENAFVIFAAYSTRHSRTRCCSKEPWRPSAAPQRLPGLFFCPKQRAELWPGPAASPSICQAAAAGCIGSG